MIYLLSDQIKINEIMFDLDIARLQTDAIQQQYQKSFMTRLYHPSNKVLSTVVPLPISNNNNNNIGTTSNNNEKTNNNNDNNKEKKQFQQQVEVEEMKERDEDKGEPQSPMHIPVYDDNEYDYYTSSSKKKNSSIKAVAGWNTILPQLSDYFIPPPHSPQQQKQQPQSQQEQNPQQQTQLQQLQLVQQQLVQRSSSLFYDPHSPLWLPLSSLHQLATSSNIRCASVSVSSSSKHHHISSQHTTTAPIVPLNSTKHLKSNRNDAILSDMDEIDSIFKSSSWSMSTLSSNMNRLVSSHSATSSYIVSKPAAAHSGSSSTAAAAGDDQITTGIGESVSVWFLFHLTIYIAIYIHFIPYIMYALFIMGMQY